MPRLYLVRHGTAAAGFDGHHDPGLSETGRAEARAVAGSLAGLGALPVRCSPLRRTRETAAPVAAALGVPVDIDPRIGEIPSPTDDLAARSEWLHRALGRRWSDLDGDVPAWRTAATEALLGSRTDAVLVTHYVFINHAIGLATGDDRVTICHPGNGSVTVVDVIDGHMSVVSMPSAGDSSLVL